MERLAPIAVGRGGGVCARVREPAAVEVFTLAGCIRRPHELRHRFGERAEGALGAHARADVGEVDGEPAAPRIRAHLKPLVERLEVFLEAGGYPVSYTHL